MPRRTAARFSLTQLSNLSASLSRSALALFLLCSHPSYILCQQNQDPLLAAAAADLAPIENELAQGFHKATGEGVTFVLGSSGMLARQIETGAPYDVYLSANEGFVKQLASNGQLLPDTVRVYAQGRIALWSKSGKIKSLEDLRGDNVLHVAIANPAHAPYGVAAREALQKQGLWVTLGPRLVYGENVRQAFQLAESGNADAVITSWTLVYDKGGILLPAEWHSAIRQAAGVIKSSAHVSAARKFLDFLTGEEGRRILERYGLSASMPSDGRGRKRSSGR